MFVKNLKYNLPDKDGFFGEFGGAFVPDDFKKVLNRLNEEFEKAIADEAFLNDVYGLLKDYSGRPTPLYFAKNLTNHYGKGKIYLKREDLNHTGAHKINNVIGQALLAKRMGAKKVIAEKPVRASMVLLLQRQLLCSGLSVMFLWVKKISSVSTLM